MNKQSHDSVSESPGVSSQPDLLKRFCELAPAEWEIKISPEGDLWLFDCYLVSNNDMESAEAIIFLWDWLGENYRLRWDDGKGWTVLLAPRAPAPSCIGAPTRIEAIVRRVVSVLEGSVTP